MGLGEEHCRSEVATSHHTSMYIISTWFSLTFFILYTLDKGEDIGLLLALVEDRASLCKLGKGESLKEPTRKIQTLSEQQQPGINSASQEI